MLYYNYHAQAKKLIHSGHLTHYEFLDRWDHIATALVLYFDIAAVVQEHIGKRFVSM